MEGLKLEWEQHKKFLIGKQIESLYFGGGTPYLLGPPLIAEIIQWAASIIPESALKEMEITLEANPENIEFHSLQEFRAAGINRLSIGLQSLDDSQLTTLSRRHSAIKGIQAIEMAYSIGFENISIDLMYDLPGQTLESWDSTIQKAASLPITHLSLYNLTIEPNTVFFKYRHSLQKRLPDDESSKKMFEMACDQFETNHLHQYEISAFAKEKYMSRHNSGYWTGRPFLGFGPSAFSYWQGKRFRNVANLSKYIQALRNQSSPIDFSEQLPLEARQRELLAIALRLLSGVDLNAFESQYGPISVECLAVLKQLVSHGFLENTFQHYKLTKRGILFYDTVATELIAHEVVGSRLV